MWPLGHFQSQMLLNFSLVLMHLNLDSSFVDIFLFHPYPACIDNIDNNITRFCNYELFKKSHKSEGKHIEVCNITVHYFGIFLTLERNNPCAFRFKSFHDADREFLHGFTVIIHSMEFININFIEHGI